MHRPECCHHLHHHCHHHCHRRRHHRRLLRRHHHRYHDHHCQAYPAFLVSRAQVSPASLASRVFRVPVCLAYLAPPVSLASLACRYCVLLPCVSLPVLL